jgi:Zn-dependent peptidase ImmA (M78 family)
VIGVNSHHPKTRQRFTIAHEVGHFCLHGHEELRVDKGLFVIRNRDATSSTGTDIEEIEANLFAAELLMPAKWLERDLLEGLGSNKRDDNLISELAKKYLVSDQALTIRTSSLGYLPL